MLGRMTGAGRDSARTAVKRLSRSGFISRQNECHHHLVLRINKHLEFRDKEQEPHSSPTVTPHQPHSSPTVAPHHRRIREEGKKEIRKEDGELFPDPSKPNTEELSYADLHRDLHKQHHPTFTGIKTDKAWRRHRPDWAREYRTLRDEIPPAEVKDLLRWTYESDVTFGDDSVTWRDVMGQASNPARAFCKHLNTIRRMHGESRPAASDARWLVDLEGF
jgi:hypothetical protein